MEIIVGYVVLAAIIGAVAGSWGRGGFWWFVIALLISPLLALILLLLMGKVQTQSGPSPRTHVLCPDCKEPVFKEARVCKHCGCRLVPDSERIEG